MAHTITDSQGTRWYVALNVTRAQRLREDGIDLLDPERLATVIEDPYARFAVLWQACRDQAAEHDIKTPEQFDAHLLPDQLSAEESERIWTEAETALREALLDFFRRIGQQALAGVITKTLQARAKLEGVAIAKLQSTQANDLIDYAAAKASAAIDQQWEQGRQSIDRLLTPGKPSTNSPGS